MVPLLEPSQTEAHLCSHHEQTVVVFKAGELAKLLAQFQLDSGQTAHV